MKKLWYPTVKTIILNNKKCLAIDKVNKSDKHKVLSQKKIIKSIKETKQKEGDIEDKAAVLMRSLNIAHPFDSANKRTAFFSANQFIYKNRGFMLAKKRVNQRDFNLKIRRDATDEEIAEWLGKGENDKWGK